MKRHIIFAVGLVGLAGCTNPQVQQAVVQGQLFCQEVTATGTLIKKVATTSGAPVSVIGQTAAQVKAWCALINAIPVPPPSAPDQAQVANVVPST